MACCCKASSRLIISVQLLDFGDQLREHNEQFRPFPPKKTGWKWAICQLVCVLVHLVVLLIGFCCANCNGHGPQGLDKVQLTRLPWSRCQPRLTVRLPTSCCFICWISTVSKAHLFVMQWNVGICWHYAKLHRLNAARALFFTDLLRLCKIRSRISHCWLHVQWCSQNSLCNLRLKPFKELRVMPASFEFQYVPTNRERGPHPTSAGRRQMQLPWLSSGFWMIFFNSFCRSIWVLAIRMENRTWKFSHVQNMAWSEHQTQSVHSQSDTQYSKCPLQLSKVALHTAGHCAGWDAWRRSCFLGVSASSMIYEIWR